MGDRCCAALGEHRAARPVDERCVFEQRLEGVVGRGVHRFSDLKSTLVHAATGPSASTVPFGPWAERGAQRRVGDVAGRLGRWSYRFVRDIIDEWSKDRAGGLAAEIAFFALLGFFPALIVLAAALGSADGILGTAAATDIETWLVDQVTTVLGGDNNVEGVVATCSPPTTAAPSRSVQCLRRMRRHGASRPSSGHSMSPTTTNNAGTGYRLGSSGSD